LSYGRKKKSIERVSTTPSPASIDDVALSIDASRKSFERSIEESSVERS
jgi:hypothetical protein